MIICKLHLPTNDGNGINVEDTIHKLLKIDILKAFNGCTITKAQGLWADNSIVFDEPIFIYEVAMWGAKYRTDQFVKIAHEYGAKAGQLAIYYSIDGKAFIDDIIPPFTVQSRPSPNNPNVT